MITWNRAALATVIGACTVMAIGVAGAWRPGLAIAVLAALLVLILCATSPQYGFILWLAALLFIPYWTSITVDGVNLTSAYLNLPVAIGFIVRAATMPRRPGRWLSRLLDTSICLAVLAVLLEQWLYGQQSFLLTNVAISLLGGYVVGRFAPESAERTFVIFATILAVWGIVEFIFGWHAFTNWFAESGGLGPAIQERGGIARSEASLGHAIAFGATLVAALPYTRRLRRPLPVQILLLLGIATSLSRGPVLAAILVLALMIYGEQKSAIRLRSILILGAGVALASVMFLLLYNGSGQGELDSSGDARGVQLGATLSATNLFGPASGTQWDSVNLRYVTNGVSIVDSTYLRFALDFGWIVTVCLLLSVAIAAVFAVARRGGSRAISLAGQIPVLAVTSMITQWQIVFFFAAGLFVQGLSRSAGLQDGSSSEMARPDLRLEVSDRLGAERGKFANGFGRSSSAARD